jgi:hypothetical protein
VSFFFKKTSNGPEWKQRRKIKAKIANPKPRVDACMDAEWRGYSAAALSLHGLTRGAPVLKWAAERLRADKALVCFLAWSNPTNLCFASPALQADAEVVAAALASPFYAEPPPPEPPSCVLRSAAEDLRASRETVLAALARSGYEFEFAGDALRADAYVAAWAGAPVGAAGGRELSRTFMRVLKSGVSVDYLDANWKSIMEDDCCVATRLGDGYFSRLLDQWPTLPLSMPLGMQGFQNHSERDKHGVCALLKQTLDARCPLCLRVAPPVRDVLWPTREDWDGVF